MMLRLRHTIISLLLYSLLFVLMATAYGEITLQEPVELEVEAEDVEDRPTGHERLSEVQVFPHPRQKFFLLEGLRSGFHLMPSSSVEHRPYTWRAFSGIYPRSYNKRVSEQEINSLLKNTWVG